MTDVDSQQAATDAVDIAKRFLEARASARALAAYPGRVPETLAEAYRAQEYEIEHWSDRLAGWKVARIGPAWQDRYPEPRLIGPAFARNVREARDGQAIECPVFEGGFAAVEAEIVIRVGADSPDGKRVWSLEEAQGLVGSIHIGVEVASSPLATLNDLGPGAVISDFGNNWGVIVGPAIPDWQATEEIAAESFIEGEPVGRGVARMREGVLGALAFTLEKCAQRKRRLVAGDVISTGMITGVHDIKIGQSSRHVFEGFGEIRCKATKAQPYERD